MENFNEKVGQKLHKLRKRKKYSLSELEQVTGVSKSMLGQIERGISSPTVKTLWKIARGLNVSFSAFVSEENEDISIVSPKNITPFIEKKNKYRVFPLFPYEKEKGFEIYLIEIASGYSHQAEPHYEGVEKYLLVKEGKINITIDEKTYELNSEEAVNFPGDSNHIYKNPGDKKSSAYVIIYY